MLHKLLIATTLSGLAGSQEDVIERLDCRLHTEDADEPLSIVVLNGEGDAGSRHLEGILAAREELDAPASVYACVYIDEEDGLVKLEELVQSGRFHVVLGPTDSGVYTAAAERRDLFRTAHTPVISGLVAARVENRQDGWLFRTNVSVESRAAKLFDHLDDSGFDSLAVIYTDTEFGRSAEAAFRGDVDNDASKTYEAFRYQTESDLRLARRKLDDARPGAVGIFAPRDRIVDIRNSIRGLQTGWNGYSPLVFSILDARTTGIEGLHFASLAGAENATDPELQPAFLRRDEVYGLGFDTAVMVFRVAAEVGDPSEGKEWQQRFRRRFASRLQQSLPREVGKKTGMTFRQRENRAYPRVLTLDDGLVVPAPLHRNRSSISGIVSLLDVRLVQWVDILERRYGFAPLIALLLVALIAGGLSVADLRSWQAGRSRSLFLEFPFLAFIAFNVIVAVSLFAFLASREHLRWDDLLGAVLVGLTYTALLKSKVFKTPNGESYGLETLYNRVIRWINDRVMVAKHDREIATIKFIAYTNSEETLKATLKHVYSFARSEKRCAELMSELEAQLAKRPVLMERRIYLAQTLKGRWSWKQLDKRRFIPRDVSERRMVDPDHIVRRCANYCLRNHLEQSLVLARECVYQHIASFSAEDRAQVKKELQAELNLTNTTMQRLEVYLRWLFVQYGFQVEPLKRTKLAPPDLDWDRLHENPVERALNWLGRLLRLRPRRDEEDADQRDWNAIRFMAYTNSTSALQKIMKLSFGETAEERDALATEIANELEKRPTDLEKRMYLAGELKERWSWARLREERLVPSDVDEGKMVDPDRIVRSCASFCLTEFPNEALPRARAQVQRHLDTLEGESKETVEASLQTELEQTSTTLQRLEVYLRWLFIQLGFQLDAIQKTGLAPSGLRWDVLLLDHPVHGPQGDPPAGAAQPAVEDAPAKA